ncbi:VOC family protein [Streptomyces chrestomyceticus]|uniref:VOC family protein n=1 Tax=Streptomyces chrestomyceticus TaxID=68185 RepID=UPI0037A809BA
MLDTMVEKGRLYMGECQMTFVPGVPSWATLLTGDLDVATRFYGPLLGWRFEAGPDRWGPYVRAMAGDTAVAGLSAAARHTELPNAWTTYFGTRNADDAANGVRERGGTVAIGPLDFDAGRLALAADPAGANFGLWECRESTVGASRPPVGTGAPVWVELRTRDAFDAARFYGDLFGWYSEADGSPYDVRWEGERVVLSVDERDAVGLYGGAIEAAADPQVRPRWNVHFQVPSVEEAVETAKKLGGRVESQAERTAHGPVAELRDPEGTLFHIIGAVT